MQALPKRQSTLVRPERQRFDNNHPQYYSSLRAIYDDNSEVDNNKDLLFMDQKEIHGIITRDTDSDITNLSSNHSILSSSIHLWKIYCYLMTCCLPPFLLGCFGKKDKTAQYAFREKVGLVSIIFYIMAGVGFLTFGFTQTVCSTPPLSFKIDELDHGHMIIHGQAYPFTSWHHPSPLNQPMIDIIGSNGGGKGSGAKDASFLFQNINQRCMNIITSKKDHVPIGSQEFPTYFPCHLFDNTNQPDPSTYQNQTGCHVTTYARLELDRLKNNGIPNTKNRLDKVGRVYYDWSDINSTNHLTVFNSNVLNLKLLFSLPLNLFNIPANGLIETAIKNPSLFGGKDISRVVVSRSHLATTTTTNNNNSNINWLQEAYCLLDIIKVGEIDTKSVGCIASDIVLYTSLLVILGTIFVKFILAVLFGWCLSWKLGHFKEGRSYKERMKREKEIENWTTSINQPADMIRPRVYSPKPKPPLFLSSKINLMPKTSRFTPPETGSKHYKPAGSVQFERPGSSPLWKHSSSVHTLGQFNSSLSQLTDLGRCTPAFSEMASLKRFSEMTMPNSKRSSLSSHTNFTTTGLSSSTSTMQCPYSLHPFAVPQPLPDFMPFGFPLIHTICLVTCYSEGEEGLRTTLDSIATTDYPNSHKLILVIADGDILGHGNSKSTPDICISMMEDLLVPKHQVQPHSYVSIADGKKRHNMARIYAGFYRYDRRTVDRSQRKRVPMITIVKCGTPEERQQEKKPGNRGKRDSQVILMSFLQKVMFDERMTRLEYELFTNIWRVAGVCPDAYEIVLMVDADTKIYPDSLSRMVSCMASDDQIAGLCGETKIGNKTDSWVSMIQVFEYYISHHQSKAFESIFGNVTCLPGCFCMYRIKAPKGNNGHWVPILANPDVIEHYSENVVDTLHKKNLLLLGEDRYLSTLMLKTFPHRKMLFVPQAVCKTVVPDTFSVLLSQRRRWINSTIHNLMELLFVNDLCGTFCFSMQFVVFMELIGTLTLPAAISFTIYLIILAFLGQPALASLLLLALILGLPAILIVMTSRKLVYVIWMLIYLISLPIWNFVLPTYAYWHFDDFTWGETRKVQGEEDNKKENSNQHSEKDGVFDSSKIIMKKWCDYEKDRRLLEI